MFDLNNPSNPLIIAGKKVGINFAMRRIVNTLNSHRLVEYAEKHVRTYFSSLRVRIECKRNECSQSLLQYGEAKQNQVIEEVFHQYFEEGKDISKVDVLVEIGAKCGLDADKVLQLALFTALLFEMTVRFLSSYAPICRAMRTRTRCSAAQ